MKVSVLASGSKGNVTLVSLSNKNILIDCGTNLKYIETNLNELNINPNSIDYILITHTHIDHISALKSFIKKYNTKVILKESIHNLLDYVNNYLYIDDEFIDNDIVIKSLATSHDALSSTAYIIEYMGKSMVYITDTGYINVKLKKALKNHDLYIFESNHDIEMLMASTRPHHIKLRILGDKGHLSNDDSAYYLKEFVTDKTKKVILAHLSGEANSDSAVLLAHKDLNKEIILARQTERTELIEI